MSSLTEIEQRLTAIEQTVADLQRQLAEQKQEPKWLDQVIGSVRDTEGFAKVLEYGRESRHADRYGKSLICRSAQRTKGN